MTQIVEIVKPRDLNDRIDMWRAPGVRIEKKMLPDGNWELTITFAETRQPETMEDDGAPGMAGPAVAPVASASHQKLGILSARFESGARSSAAIGEDSTGGPSYGKYQIATKTGTFATFMTFLAQEFPTLHAKLEAAGGTVAASRKDAGFVQTWKDLARAGDALPEAEHAFIKATHYKPFVHRLDGIGLHVARRSFALQNVIWSVAVQHGPGNSVVKNALDDLNDPATLSERQVIEAIYKERSKVNIYFRRSTPAVKAAVKSRFKREKKDALEMLSAEGN